MSRLPRTSQIELPRWSSPWSSLLISVARMRAGPTNRPDPCLFWPASWPVNCFLQIYTKSPAEKSKTCRCRELVALEIRCWHCQSIRAFSAVAILSQFSCCMALGSKHVSSGQDGSTVEKKPTGHVRCSAHDMLQWRVAPDVILGVENADAVRQGIRSWNIWMISHYFLQQILDWLYASFTWIQFPVCLSGDYVQKYPLSIAKLRNLMTTEGTVRV